MKMIHLTIKTLDSTNHTFDVSDETTVLQLKEKVLEAMGIEIDLQRLIFCGRVLQDDKKLSDYNVDGKVIHLVQRPPPHPDERQQAHENPPCAGPAPRAHGVNLHNAPEPAGAQQRIRRLLTSASNQPSWWGQDDGEESISRSPVLSRLDNIRRLIYEIKQLMQLLNLQMDPDSEDWHVPANNGVPSGEPPVTEHSERTRNARQEDDPLLYQPDPNSQEVINARRGYAFFDDPADVYEPRGPNRPRSGRPRELALLLEELDRLHERCQPYRSYYSRLLRTFGNTEIPNFTEEEIQREQNFAEMVSDLMHSFSHAYHTISDFNLQVGELHNRLLADPPHPIPLRHPVPMQAHINVMHANRRPPAAAAAGVAVAAGVAAPAAPATNDGMAGRTPVQPSVNVTAHPNPITYQVEIEARMPVAFALDNAFLDGISQAASGQPFAPQQPPPDASQPAPQVPPQAPPQAPPQPNQQPAAGQTGPLDPLTRRQALLDLDNLFRGLSQAGNLGGVEVVMSMEEIPPPGPFPGPLPSMPNNQGAGLAAEGTPNPTAPPQPAAGGNQGNVQILGVELFMGAMPWGGPPNAQVLQNIVASVIRQGLVPGVPPGEGVNIRFPLIPGNLDQQAQQPQQAPNQPAQPNQQQQPNQGQNGQGQAPNNAEGQQGIPNNVGRPHIQVRRATTSNRMNPFANMVYDHFLACESHHAWVHASRRRDMSIQQRIDRERARAVRAGAMNIQMLMEVNLNITLEHIRTLLRLLNEPPSRVTWINAVLVIIARQLYLAELTHPQADDIPMVPRDFQPLRALMRSFLERVFSEVDGDIHSFRTVADYFVEQNVPYLQMMHIITPVRPDVDIVASLQWLTRCRLPAIFAAVMSEAEDDIVAPRFYWAFARLFIDVITLLNYYCNNRVPGVRQIFSAYVDELVHELDPPVQSLLTTLSNENLNIVLESMGPVSSIMPYVRRLPSPPEDPTPSVPSEEEGEEEESGSSQICLTPKTPTSPPPAPSWPTSPTSEEESGSSPIFLTPKTPTSPPTPPTPPPAPSWPTSPTSLPAPQPMQTTPPVTPPTTANAVSQPVQSFTKPLTVEDAIVAAAACAVHPSASSSRVNNNAATSPVQRVITNVSSTPSSPLNRPPRSESAPLTLPSEDEIKVNFEHRWLRVLQRDCQRQTASEAQGPVSDAYLSGMPTRKRRRIREQRPPCDLADFVTESVRDSAAAPLQVPTDVPTVLRLVRNQLRSLGSSRARRSIDFSPDRHRSADRFARPHESESESEQES